MTGFQIVWDDRAPRHWLEEQQARCESVLLDEVCAAVAKIDEQVAQDAVDALMRLEAGTYGYCVDCHMRIPEDRLDAASFAVRCPDCERAREISGPHNALPMA